MKEGELHKEHTDKTLLDILIDTYVKCGCRFVYMEQLVMKKAEIACSFPGEQLKVNSSRI